MSTVQAAHMVIGQILATKRDYRNTIISIPRALKDAVDRHMRTATLKTAAGEEVVVTINPRAWIYREIYKMHAVVTRADGTIVSIWESS